MPHIIDFVFATLFAVVLMAFETLYYFPRFRAQLAAGVPGARLKGYRRTTIGQWVVAAIALALWIAYARPWSALRLVPPGDWHLIAAVGLTVGILVFGIHQLSSIHRARPDQLQAYAPKIAYVEMILPHTRTERRWFVALSITAGICEELLYRGYLLWLFASFTGVWVGAVATIVLFAGGHSYQGREGIVKSGAAAIVMTALVLVSGSLYPAMLLHAIVDISGGLLGYAVITRAAPVATGSGVAAGV